MHRLSATDEISGYRQCWESDGSHVLWQRRRDTYSLRSQEYNNEGWLTKKCYERSFFQHYVKNCTRSLQLSSFIATTLLLFGRLGFTSFPTTTNFKLFLMLRTHLTTHQSIFGCFQHCKEFFLVSNSSRSALATTIFQWSQRTPKEAFSAAMHSWRHRCEKCVV